MPAGRPTNYMPDFPERAMEYAEGGYKDHEHVIPSIEGLARVLQRAVSSIKNWRADPDKPEFMAALKALEGEQRRALTENGLIGKYNPTITKLLLSANHGVHERNEVDVDANVAVTEITRTIVRASEHTDS